MSFASQVDAQHVLANFWKSKAIDVTNVQGGMDAFESQETGVGKNSVKSKVEKGSQPFQSSHLQIASTVWETK